MKVLSRITVLSDCPKLFKTVTVSLITILPIFWFLSPVGSQPLSKPEKPLTNSTKSALSVRLDQLAKSITVKVFSGNNWGSGILLQKQGMIYTVVTNRHVLSLLKPPYQIQTSDGRIHPAYLPATALQFDGNDLALLQFRSVNQTYTVATLKTSDTLSEGDKVFAAGFPFDKPGFVLTKGRVSLLSHQALEQGYQIGYTNNIQKGMSGGPLLNFQGEVVGINGMHAYPLWGDPYVYRDGSLPSIDMRDRMISLAFAIPIETFAKLAPQYAFLPLHLPWQQSRLFSRQHSLNFWDLLGLMPTKPKGHSIQEVEKNSKTLMNSTINEGKK